jgi:hypothetical protein
MIGRIEFPGEDKIDETKNLRVMQDKEEGLYLVGENFFLWIDSTKELVDELIKFTKD